MDDLQRSLLNVFAASDLDRVVLRRKDQAWSERLGLSDEARHIPFFQGRFLSSREPDVAPAWLNIDQMSRLGEAAATKVFLGMRDSEGYFAVDVAEGAAVERLSGEELGFVDLRQVGSLLRPQDASVISYAKALFHWHHAHQYCGFCGSETKPAQAGHVRQCMNSACGKTHFPRTDPAIIVAVTRGERCLFGRQPSWPPRRYSVIAGFVEPGESIEQAVVREVMEETDIVIDTVKYRSSQPWPFPGSIMLGFWATAGTERISLNDGELQEAHWRCPSEVVEGLLEGSFLLPPRLSIAYRLIEEWFDSHSREPLADVIVRIGCKSEPG